MAQTVVVEGSCIFCRIVAKEAPAYVVAEDVHTMAFLDRSPANPGHTLVVPRAHAADIWTISEGDAAAVMVMAKRVAQIMDERLEPQGVNLIQANRDAGWQDVFHFHLHVVPRWNGDDLVRPWRPRRATDDQLASTLALLRSAES